MIREYEKKPPGYASMMTALFLQLIVYLCRSYLPAETAGRASEESNPIVTTLARTVAYMEQTYMEPLTLRSLATRACLSVPHFSRVFKQYYGTSPLDYLIKLRTNQARRLLA